MCIHVLGGKGGSNGPSTAKGRGKSAARARQERGKSAARVREEDRARAWRECGEHAARPSSVHSEKKAWDYASVGLESSAVTVTSEQLRLGSGSANRTRKEAEVGEVAEAIDRERRGRVRRTERPTKLLGQNLQMVRGVRAYGRYE